MMKAIIFLLLSSVMSVNLWAAELLSDDVLYGKIRERFPELSLPEEQPTTIVHVCDETNLKNEIGDVSGHKVICVSGAITLTGYLPIIITSGSRVTIVGVTQAGEFKYATITGKGILSKSAGQVDIANLYFTNIEQDDNDKGVFGNAILLEGIAGEHRITSVTIDNCISNGDSRGGAIYVAFATGSTKPSVLICNTTIGANCVATSANAAPLYASNATTVSLINCTIIASNGKDKNGNDVKKNVYWLPSSPPKVVTNVLFDQAPTVTIKDGWTYKVESNLVWVKDGVNLPHYEFATTSAALDTGSEISSVLKYDALGNLRDDGNGTDFGAVEITNPATELRKPIRIIVR